MKIDFCVVEGGTHNFKMYEQDIGSAISSNKKVQTDKGYQGIAKAT